MFFSLFIYSWNRISFCFKLTLAWTVCSLNYLLNSSIFKQCAEYRIQSEFALLQVEGSYCDLVNSYFIFQWIHSYSDRLKSFCFLLIYIRLPNAQITVTTNTLQTNFHIIIHSASLVTIWSYRSDMYFFIIILLTMQKFPDEYY